MHTPQIRIRPLLLALACLVSAPFTQALEVIVDDAQAIQTPAASWTAGSSAGYYGSGYIHDGAVKTTVKTARFTPTIPSYGNYQVFMRWVSGSNRSNHVPVTITTSSGTLAPVYVDETTNNGQWMSLGTYTFNAGTNGNVLVSNEGTAANTYVIADAVKFVQVPASEVILDNTSGLSLGVEVTGTWTSQTAQAGYYGTDYIHDGNANKGSSNVRYTPILAQSGFYELFARWTSNTNRATNVPITVISATGNKTLTVNQQANGGSWQSLGVYGFNSNARGGVIIANRNTSVAPYIDTNGYVIADAVKFTPVAAPAWTPSHLGDQVWLDWWAEDLAGLANGTSVSGWTSRSGGVAATQSTSTKQPVKQTGELVFTNAQQLVFPEQKTANTVHRGVMILFRVDLTGTSGSGSIFAVNGYSGGYQKQPSISYNRNTNAIGVSWSSASASNGIAFPAPEDKTVWHCLVSRRVNTPTGPVHYASLDGKDSSGNYGESQIAMADWAMPEANTSTPGYIGDYQTSNSPEIGIDTVMLLQDELSATDAQKLTGWAMWRRGVQANLPSTHPYRNAAPVASVPAYAFDESTPSEYSALSTYWNNTAQSEAYKGTTLSTSGWNLVFQDEFDQHTVTHQDRGRGNWFAPVHGDPTGGAKAIVPPYNTTDPTLGNEGTPATYIQSGSTMTIRMQQTVAGDKNTWKSGAFCSVNANGFGRAWMYPYVEIRMKTGPSTTGNLHGSWPALWVKSINSFFNHSESYLEYDFYEGYGTDTKGFHNSYHNWAADRLYPGRLLGDRYKSNYLGLTATGWNPAVNLFDGQYHTYGVMVTPTHVINMFDGRETFRVPTTIEMKQPLWILVDLAMQEGSTEMDQASGIYEMTIDYIKVYQNPANPGYGQ